MHKLLTEAGYAFKRSADCCSHSWLEGRYGILIDGGKRKLLLCFQVILRRENFGILSYVRDIILRDEIRYLNFIAEAESCLKYRK